jgi:ABC-type multidrug transport system fused ATPase/permease subunit
LADHLVVIDRGRVRAQGSFDELVEDRDPVVQAVLAAGP